MKDLKFHLAKIRHGKSLTAKQLSAKSSVHLRTIEFIESGKANPSIKTLCKLADALEVPVTELFTYE